MKSADPLQPNGELDLVISLTWCGWGMDSVF